MAKKELQKLNRAELLHLLIAQTERADRLQAELVEAKEQIRNREKLINQSGDLASAATKLLNAIGAEKLNIKMAMQQQPEIKFVQPQEKQVTQKSAGQQTAQTKKPVQSQSAIPKKAAQPKPAAPIQSTKGLPQKPSLTPQQLMVLQQNRSRLTPAQLELLKKEEALHYRWARLQSEQDPQKQALISAIQSGLQDAPAQPQLKEIKNGSKGIDLSAIRAITSGIGKGTI